MPSATGRLRTVPTRLDSLVDLTERLANARWTDLTRRATDPATSVGELTALGHHPSFAVRAAVAAHPACPADVLWVLSTDAHRSVRRAVAQRRPPEAADD